jgi:hypothetical protein
MGRHSHHNIMETTFTFDISPCDKHYYLRFYRELVNTRSSNEQVMEEKDVCGFSLEGIEKIAMKILEEEGYSECCILKVKSIISVKRGKKVGSRKCM